MTKLLTLLVITLSLLGFNANTYAESHGAKAADAADQGQMTAEEAKAKKEKMKKKKKGDEEEPECE